MYSKGSPQRSGGGGGSASTPCARRVGLPTQLLLLRATSTCRQQIARPRLSRCRFRLGAESATSVQPTALAPLRAGEEAQWTSGPALAAPGLPGDLPLLQPFALPNMPPCSISLRPRLTSAGPSSHLTSRSDWTPWKPGSMTKPGGLGTLTCVSLVLSLSEMWRSTIVAAWPFATPDATALLMHACRRSTAPASVSRRASLFSRRTRMLTCGKGG